MSVMSAAEAGGQSAGASPELSPRGARMAGSVSDPCDTGGEPGSPGGRPSQPGPPPGAATADGRRLRLVTTEVRVTKVRVAREVSTAAVRAGHRVGAGQPAPARQPDGAGQPAPAGRPGAAGWESGWPGRGGTGISVHRASVQRASAARVEAPGFTARQVRVQRAGVGRVSVQRAAPAPRGLRLTRRGRRVLTGFVMLAAIFTAMLIWTSVAAGGAQVPGAGSSARSPYQGMTQIVVRPGQTLWSVAIAAEPSANPWAVIQQISDVNALNGAQIQAGQLLWVPRG